jgi:hypothetical protein
MHKVAAGISLKNKQVIAPITATDDTKNLNVFIIYMFKSITYTSRGS